MIKQIHIYDIDGTLVDSTHRYRYEIAPDGWRRIDFPFWVNNRHTAMQDTLLPLAAQYQRQRLDPEIFTVLATSRVMTPAEWEHITTQLLMPDHFISRNDGDTQSGTTLKIDALTVMFNSMPELLQVKERYFYEDNISYLNAVCDAHACVPVYVPSKQGY